MVRSINILALIGLAVAAATSAGIKPAAAISAELAKKCRELAVKAHPYKLPGQPGAGNAKAERDYFSACVAQNGNSPSEPSGTNQSKTAPAPAQPNSSK